jgi:putative FmdB family regulatory protein
MPTYEYECRPCRVIYQTRHGINDSPVKTCPSCGGDVQRLVSAPNLNLKNFSSPTEAKYSKISLSDEVKMEKELQKDYQTIWLPSPVKHNPWEEH